MASNPPVIDYAAVIADLKARRAQIDAAIAGLEAANFAQAVSSALASFEAGNSQASGNGVVVQRDTFFNLSIPEATKKYLAMRKGAATTNEIIEALRNGGQASGTSDGFGVTVTSGLHRAYKQGVGIVRVGRGTWGLAEWYPNKPRKPQETE